MVRHALLLGLALGLSRDPSCGSVPSATSGVEAPCTRSSDCEGNLTCTGGVCTAADSGAPSDATATDALNAG